MRAKAGYLILLGLLLIIGTVSASVADSSSTLLPSKDWPVANGGDSSVLTVTAKNLTTAPPLVGNAQVIFTIDDGNYGFFSPSTVMTDINGIATTTFMTKTKSGTAVITATITSTDMYGTHTEPVTLYLHIDHDIPHSAVFDLPARLPVGNISVLNVTVLDAHLNRVDNKGPGTLEHHTFNLYMPGEQGRGLWDGSNFVTTKQVETDADGNASIKYRMAYPAQMNQIYMDVIGDMVMPPEKWVEGIGLDEPVYINHIHPSPDDINADGIAYFGLYFYAYDMYMNPVNATPVHVEADDGTTFDDKTNTLGAYYTPFGPKDTASLYNVTMTVSNTSAVCLATGKIGYCSQNLTFHNTDPVDLIVTANPQGMPSLDVNPASRGTITAKVVDVKGNSVIGETVSIAMQPRTYMWPGGIFNETMAPTPATASTTTGTGGVATFTFTPGAFATSLTPDSFNATATGEATYAVTWTNKAGTITKTKYVTFIWKNYPYLSITVPTDACKNAVVGDKIDIKLSLFGDGAALRPKPIDVMLINDRSGSMLGDNPDKMVSVMDAAIFFATQLDDSKDRIGQYSFAYPNGWADLTGVSGSPYCSRYQAGADTNNHPSGGGCGWGNDDATYIAAHYHGNAHNYGTNKDTLDLGLTANPITNAATVNTAINGMVPAGNTPTRDALYDAVQYQIDHPRTGAVKAVILLTDGNCNTDGSPKGGTNYCPSDWNSPVSLPNIGTGSVITYAQAHNVTIYVIGLGSDVQTAELKSYTAKPATQYYAAPTGADLTGIYTKIAGDMQQTAGGNTKVTLDYGTVNIDGVLGNILDYMSYEKKVSMPSQPGDSTYVMKKNMTKTGAETLVYQYSRDDSANWTAKQMKFEVGEMQLNDTWATSFTVNLTQAGQIEMFGPTSPSQVCFTDASTGATTCQKFPPWSCPVQQSKVDVGFGSRNLTINNMTLTPDAWNSNIITIGWNVTYDGEKSAQQRIQYYTGAGIPKQVPGGLMFDTACNGKMKRITVDTTTWAPGTYTFTVDASTVDAKSPPQITYNWQKNAPAGQKFIKLE